MDRLIAVAVVILSAVVIADGRHTGRLAVALVAGAVVVVAGRSIRQRLTDTDVEPTMSFIAEQPPETPSVATHDITELANLIGRGRRGALPTEIADRIRTIARRRLDDDGAMRLDAPAQLSPTLAGVLDGADVRVDQLDALLGELEEL